MDAYTSINQTHVDLFAVQKEAARLKQLAELFDFAELMTETLETLKVRFVYVVTIVCCLFPAENVSLTCFIPTHTRTHTDTP